MAISTSSSPAGDQVRTARSRFIPPLWEQVIAGIVIGLILGFAAPAFSEHIKVVGTAFIRLLEMVIIPLLFPLIVLSIARTGSARSTGRLAVKSLVYFEVVTTVILAITVLLALAAGLGHGANLHDAPVATTGGVQKSLLIQTILLNIIPDNIIGTLSTGNLLRMLFFAVLLGLALGRTGTKAKPLLDVLDGLASAMFYIISWVIASRHWRSSRSSPTTPRSTAGICSSSWPCSLSCSTSRPPSCSASYSPWSRTSSAPPTSPCCAPSVTCS